jgi:hypothetical protein
LEYTNGLALGYELKKTEDISRSIAAFLVDISNIKNFCGIALFSNRTFCPEGNKLTKY